MLQKNGIAFREFSLDDQAYATEMLKKLKSAGYADRIHLPVIFEDDTLVLHPVTPHNDSTLYFVIQKIIAEKESYTSSDSIRTEVIPPPEEEGESDCELTRGHDPLFVETLCTTSLLGYKLNKHAIKQLQKS